MKKTFKRLGAMLLAMAMAVSVLCTGALADDNAPKTYTIQTDTEDTHSYSVYQIFTGTLAMDEKTLSDVKWGKNGKNDTAAATEGTAVPEVVLTELANVKDSTSNKEKLTVIKKYVDVNGTAYGTVSKDSPLSNVPAGYYLIKDSTAVTGNDAATNYIVEVGADINITRKTGVPEVDKTVNGKAADTANIGDEVEFKLFATLPNNYEDYSSYKLVFNDTLSAGLTLTDDELNALTVKVYTSKENATSDSNGVELKKDDTNGYSAVKVNDNDNKTKLTVSFTDLKKAQQKDSDTTADIKNNYCVVVTYKATLNENAVLGGTGNLNTVNLTYSNDPNNASEGTTTDKEVPVYTFQMNVVKTDGENSLSDAKFVLATKKLTKTEDATATDVNVITSDDIETYKADLVAVTKNTDPTYTVGGSSYEMTVSAADATKGQLNIKGLKDGTYYLYETQSPDGYNKLTEPIKIEIKAGVTEGTDPVFNGAVSAEVTSKNTDGTDKTENITEKTSETEKGILNEITVVNNAGSQLPSTGGMGTTLFYIFGGVLMAGAAIVLVIKKKRSSAE